MATLTFAALLLCLPQEPAGQEPAGNSLERIERDVAAVVERARASVVAVTATFVAEFEPRVQVGESVTFSGVAWSKDGLILTDASGLERAVQITVTLPDGRKLPAQLVGSDKRTSVAVLRVEGVELTPAEPATAKDVRQGVYAIVIGNPLGMKGSSSVGFISGLGRTIMTQGRRYQGMVQMTTTLNPGDCGGFVANSRGQLLGLVHSSYQSEAMDIETMGLLKLFGKDYADLLPTGQAAMSFATHVSTLSFVAERILKHGRMVRGWAGLTVRPVEAAVREQLSLPEDQGLEVSTLDRSGPAARAGLKRRDILIEWDGKPVNDAAALRHWVETLEEPRRVRVAFLRGGVRQETEIDVALDPQK